MSTHAQQWKLLWPMQAPFRDKLCGDVSELKLSTAFCTYIGVDKMLEEVEYIINSVISIRFAADGVGGWSPYHEDMTS